VEGGVARARLVGSLRMKQTFYLHLDDNLFGEATVLGDVP
jgi:hypothetical protein